ncbi:acyl-CoA dehydrogenase family protein [Sporichthya sp.]|uniref:acyl-CoA dehydrogenase family protein n=1 Tax=Sporichthya sp. TaxID=65475 RepID=UPI0017B2744D|nr:acyl-CoA dehydrogenase family protein [Sporichthya sp.]MBA3741383.1 acyl-CoA dehydrogenase family protein [Sporichthya sp.]
MDFGLPDDSRRFLSELRSYLDGLNLDKVVAETLEDDHEAGPAGQEMLAQMGRDGWLGIGWPAEHGGRGRSAVDQWLYLEEMAYRRLPAGGLSITSVGPTLMKLGTAEQKAEFLPAILRAEVRFAVGYSEPDAGSDVASLRTRAVRVGDEYVVKGQKIYTTGAHDCSHIWLAVRTHPTETRHRGLSVLLVALDSLGVTVQPIYTQADTRTNEVYFDDVRVPVANLVGEENEGWAAMMVALDFERIFVYAAALKDFEELVAWTRVFPSEKSPLIADRTVAHRLAEMAADLEVARLLALRTACIIDTGVVPTAEAAALKVWISELRHRIATEGLAIVGEHGQLKAGEDAAPAAGQLEHQYRAGTVLKFASGTNEVMRDIIAQRALHLPRARALGKVYG